jgi:hypothetical protein
MRLFAFLSAASLLYAKTLERQKWFTNKWLVIAFQLLLRPENES